MTESNEFTTNGQLMREVQKAQKILDEVEMKTRSYKKQKLVQNHQSRGNKAPYPDLTKYFTYFNTQHIQSDKSDTSQQSQEPQRRKQTQILQRPKQKDARQKGKVVSDDSFSTNKENSSALPNKSQHTVDKTATTIAIAKLEEYYAEQCHHIQREMVEIIARIQKIRKDQALLIRNNKELEQGIQLSRRVDSSNRKERELRRNNQEIRNEIKWLERENEMVRSRKRDLQENIKSVSRVHREQLVADMHAKPKSNQRCPFH